MRPLAAVVVVLGLAGCAGQAPAPPSAAAPSVTSSPREGVAGVAPSVLGPAATLTPTARPSAGGTSAGGTSAGGVAAGQARSGAGNGGEAVRPQVLVLPSGKKAGVDPAGVHDDGTLVVPDLPSRVGWWTGGAEAGDPYGGMVIAGHVDSRKYGLGALAELAKVKVGAVLAVSGTTAEGTARTLRYRVDAVTEVQQVDLVAEAAPFAQDVPHRLVLITCGGPFDTVTHHYRDNVVVTATPVA